MPSMPRVAAQRSKAEWEHHDFNIGVEFDSLFLEEHKAIHVIYVNIRLPIASFVDSRKSVDVFQAITHDGFRIFGPPKHVTPEQECTLASNEGAIWAVVGHFF